MTGDAEMQPVESEDPLSDLVDAIEPGDKEGDDPKPDDETETPEPEDEPEDEDPDEGDPDDKDDDKEKDDEDEPTVTIKHDGKDVTLKQSEVVELAQQGFDYTKKTMAVAEERKAVEAKRTEVDQLRKHHEDALTATLDRLNAFQKYMQAQIGEPPPITLAQEDSYAYLAAKQLYEDRKGQLEQAQKAIGNVQTEAQRIRQAQMSEQADATEKALRDTIPGWNENTLSELAGYLGQNGLTPQNAEAAFVTEGLWTLAHKAQAYDAIQAKKLTMKPTEKLAKVVKPAANNVSSKTANRAKREAEFDKNPSVDALANLLG
jgi:hypothetical protein